jgi:hypothetical protein
MGLFEWKHMKCLVWVDRPSIWCLGKTLEKECMGGSRMLCVMRVLDEFEPKEVTNLVSIPKCVKWILDEFPNVMLKKLPDELPPRRWIDHAIEVM